MLSLAKAAKDYYLQKLGEMSPREDYYLRGGSATGIWRGSGAAEQDLNGAVSAEGLVRLLDGEQPDTGEQLGRRLRNDGGAAWEVTLPADKAGAVRGACARRCGTEWRGDRGGWRCPHPPIPRGREMDR